MPTAVGRLLLKAAQCRQQGDVVGYERCRAFALALRPELAQITPEPGRRIVGNLSLFDGDGRPHPEPEPA
jgi:hypothetical protein